MSKAIGIKIEERIMTIFSRYAACCGSQGEQLQRFKETFCTVPGESSRILNGFILKLPINGSFGKVVKLSIGRFACSSHLQYATTLYTTWRET